MIAVRVRGIQDLGETVPSVVARLAEEAGLTVSQAYRMRLATEEIATNIVTHGYGGGAGTIAIDAGYDDAWAWVRLEDEAPEFDPNAHDATPRPADDSGLAPLGGFGLFLALSSVDCLEHAHVAGRNRNVLKIRRGGGAHDEATRAGRG